MDELLDPTSVMPHQQLPKQLPSLPKSSAALVIAQELSSLPELTTLNTFDARQASAGTQITDLASHSSNNTPRFVLAAHHYPQDEVGRVNRA